MHYRVLPSCGDFSTYDAPRPERATPEVIEKLYELVLEDRRISAKSIAEQLSISSERVGFIIHEYLEMRSSPRNGSRNA